MTEYIERFEKTYRLTGPITYPDRIALTFHEVCKIKIMLHRIISIGWSPSFYRKLGTPSTTMRSRRVSTWARSRSGDLGFLPGFLPLMTVPAGLGRPVGGWRLILSGWGHLFVKSKNQNLEYCTEWPSSTSLTPLSTYSRRLPRLDLRPAPE